MSLAEDNQPEATLLSDMGYYALQRHPSLINTRNTCCDLRSLSIGWLTMKSLTECRIAKIQARQLLAMRHWNKSRYAMIRLGVVRCSNFWTNGKQDVEVKVMSWQYVHLIWWYQDGPIREHNTLKLLMHEHNNQRELVALWTSRLSWFLGHAIRHTTSHSDIQMSSTNCGLDCK